MKNILIVEDQVEALKLLGMVLRADDRKVFLTESVIPVSCRFGERSCQAAIP